MAQSRPWAHLPPQTSTRYGHTFDGIEGQTTERPKVLYFTSVRRSAGHFLIFHFPPLAIILVLLDVYLANLSFDIANDALAALLVAAKVHEALIIASLFHVVYYHIRRGLLSNSGIPFGYLTSAFQLNSPFYIANSSFFAPILRQRPASASSVALAFLLVLTFMLSALVGASSGIVMLPRLDWWEIDLARVDSLAVKWQGHFTNTVVAPADKLYPSAVTLKSFPIPCRELTGICPSYWDPLPNSVRKDSLLWAWIGRIAKNGGDAPLDMILNNKMITSWNDPQYDNTLPPGVLAMPPYVATTPAQPMVPLTVSAAEKKQWATAYPFPTQLTARIFNQDGRVLPLRQPWVGVQCALSGAGLGLERPSSAEGGSYDFRMFPGLFPAFNFSVDASVIPYSPIGLSFVDPSNFSLPINASAAFWMHDPRPEHSRDSVDLCFVDARWVSSTMWVFPKEGNVARFNYSMRNGIITPESHPEEIVSLERAWLDAFNDAVTIGDAAGANATGLTRIRPLELISQAVLSSEYDDFTSRPGEARWNREVVSWIMAIYLTEVLSNLLAAYARDAFSTSPLGPWNVSSANVFNAPFVPNNDFPLEELPDYARIEVRYFHNVYEYNFQGTTTKLAWAMLFVYTLLLLVHGIVVCVHGAWYSGAWSQLGDLVALAMNARPPELLRGTGGGVSDWNTWRLTAFVRVVGSGKEVELVLRDGAHPLRSHRRWVGADHDRPPRPGEKYG